MDDDGIPICKLGLRMHKDGYEATKHCAKYRCPKANRKWALNPRGFKKVREDNKLPKSKTKRKNAIPPVK